jgi:hypothetical protein
MAGPYTWNVAVPDGATETIRQLDDRIRDVKATLQTAFTDGWMSGWPEHAHCTLGWPRILVSATVAALPAVASPYQRLAYVTQTKHLYLEMATGWRNVYPSGTRTILPPTGLTGDGFIATPNPAGWGCPPWSSEGQTLNFYQVSEAGRPTYKALVIGPDYPCGQDSIYRAFLRFPISTAPQYEIGSVVLRVHLMEKNVTGGSVGVSRVQDFGTLDAGDWAIPTILPELGTILTPASLVFAPADLDVTAAYLAAKAAAATHFAVRLYHTNEGEGTGTSRWYGITASDDDHGNPLPGLRITFT